MSEIKLRKGESVDRGLKRLKKIVDREGTIEEIRKRKYYEKPSVKKRERRKKAKFEQMLLSRREKQWR